MSQSSHITIEEGSTNVYADQGYADAAEMQRKSQLAAEIARAIRARRLTQQGAAATFTGAACKPAREDICVKLNLMRCIPSGRGNTVRAGAASQGLGATAAGHD